MNYKKEINILIETVKKYRKDRGLPYRNEDIAGILGYNRTYLSGLLGKNGIVTQDHIKQFKLNFPFLSENNTHTLNEDATNYKPGSGKFEKVKFTDVAIEKIVSDLMESVISLEAKVSVLEQLADISVSHQTGSSVPVVSAERRRAVAMDAERILDERKKRYGKA